MGGARKQFFGAIWDMIVGATWDYQVSYIRCDQGSPKNIRWQLGITKYHFRGNPGGVSGLGTLHKSKFSRNYNEFISAHDGSVRLTILSLSLLRTPKDTKPSQLIGLPHKFTFGGIVDELIR